MGFLRIHCHACGGAWEVYRRQVDGAAARECPHCGKRIEQGVWNGEIRPAYKAFEGANAALPDLPTRFEVDYIADRAFKNADLGEIAARVLNIETGVEDLLAEFDNDSPSDL